MSAASGASDPVGAHPRVLVAGVGNIFLGDDGFGPAVARRLAAHALPDGVRVVDYGIRGMHLAYDLLDGWDVLVVVDTIPARGQPGAVQLLEVTADDVPRAAMDAHGMDPVSVLAGVTALGGSLPRTLVVGCQPARLDEGIGLSADVEAGVERAVAEVLGVLDELVPAAAGGG
ncbi:MAG: hydrogenase maturation protease [Actinomycetota bacterium]